MKNLLQTFGLPMSKRKKTLSANLSYEHTCGNDLSFLAMAEGWATSLVRVEKLTSRFWWGKK